MYKLYDNIITFKGYMKLHLHEGGNLDLITVDNMLCLWENRCEISTWKEAKRWEDGTFAAFDHYATHSYWSAG